MNYKKIVAYSYITILVIIYYMALPVSIFKGLPMGDTPIFEYFGYAMTKGELMYSNLFDHKGPFIFISHYIGWLIHEEIGIKLLFAVCIFVFLYFSYRITKIFSQGYEYTVVLFVIFISYMYVSEKGLNVETLALPFITASLYFYLEYFIKNQINSIRIMLLGAMFCVTFFIRANMIGVWLFMSILFMVHNILKKKMGDIIKYILLFLVGVMIVFIPLISYMLFKGNLIDMFYQAFYINFKYAGGEGVGRRTILLWAISIFKEVSLLFIIIAANLCKRTDKKLIIYNIFVVLLILLALISKREYPHYLIVTIPLFIPYVAIIMECIFKREINKHKICVLFLGIYMLFSSNISNIYDDISMRKNVDVDLESVANYINENTDKGDKIYAHRLTGAVYLSSQRLSSTKYFFIPSIPEELFINDFKDSFKNSKPKYIVLNKNYLGDKEVDKYIVELSVSSYSLEKTIKEYDIYVIKN